MKITVSIDGVRACVTIDGAWTPELIATVLRTCGDEALRICFITPAEDGATGGPDVG